MVGERERNLLELGALALEHREGLADGPLDARLHAFDGEVLLRHAEAQTLHALLQIGAQVIVREISDHRRVVRVLTEYRLADDGSVFDRVRERSDLIERRRESDDAPARHAPVRRLHTDDAAERGRLPDRATGIGAERKEHLAGRDGDRRTAGRPARYAFEAPGVLDRPESGVLIGRTHREFVEVGLPDHDRAPRVETLHDRRGVGRNVLLKDP